MARPDGEPSGIKTDRIPPVVVEGPPYELLAAGRVLANRYELLALIGKGGMGEVWRAHDRKLEEDIALKVLLPERLHDPEMLKNLRSEVKHARRISHANVCRVFDVGEDGELLFLTMELIEGRTLRALLTAGSLAPEATLGMLQQIVEGLAAVHAKGIIHRDLKPENVLVRSATGQPVVADFGLARIPVADQGFTDVAGTPAYMSPEQLRGDPLDARSDIFSLGLLAFEMLTGSLPFGGGSSVTKNRGIFRIPPNRLHVTALPPPFVRSLDKVLARAMAQDPADRYASAAEFGVALGSVRGSNLLARADDEPAGVARRVGRWLQRRRLNRWAAFGLAATLPTVAAAAVALNVRGVSDDPRPSILVAPLDNLTGDPSWNGLAQGAVEAIRTGLRTIPQVRLIDAPRSEARLSGGRSNATWVAAGSVQRVGASLRLEVQLRAAGGAAVGEPIEIDGDPADPSLLPETLRRRALGEVRLLVNDYDRRRRAETGTKNPIAKARLREYYALVNPTPRPEDFENGERLLDEALAADPRYVPALIERATLRLQVGRSHAKPETRAAALADVERAIAIDPKEPNALAFRCRAMQIESNFSDRSTDAAIATAIDACNDALRVDPASAHARLALARLHESACQTEIAMTSLQRALEPEVDRSLSGWLYMQLVHVALQEGKISLADRVSQQLVDFYEEERRLGGRAYSRRAGILPIQGAHMLRAAVLMRLGQPESLEKARQELLGELDTMSGGIGDRWNEAAALRGLLRIAQLRGSTPPPAWQERLGSLERDYRAIAQENPGVLHGAALSYRWIAPEGALELIGMLGPPASFQEAFDRALISHAAGNDQEARRALELHPATERWEQRCRSWIQSQLAY